MLNFQGGDLVIPRHHTLMELYKRVHLFVIEAGFYEISQLRDIYIYINDTLIVVLVEQ